ncbi:metal ABC transporter solute-binding protein, Zn/Mn family [Mycobacterium sp. SMC-4]|uniref:metal ABC transporter solute-binding protein, Zn/Mn family n=1 Tax=Mycobacterium sp. SMC-4 TaxID=2857059 RepID=UPI003CFC6133
MRALVAAAVSAALTFSMVGCSTSQDDNDPPDGVAVVASTDVWGSVAQAVVGDHATVTSIMTGTVADPHSFEASPADAAAVSDASLVVYNGGHYDHWIDQVLQNAPDVTRVDAYSLTPVPENATETPNEHVFYDLPTVKAVADRVAELLTEADSVNAADYAANAERFGSEIDTLAMAQRAVGQAHPGASVVSTEPVAYYALRNAGITDKTPPSFARSVEHGGDPAPADVAAMLDLITTRQVSAVVVNSQTASPVTRQIADAATEASLPVITVTETLPEGSDYLQWQRATIDQIAAQLDAARSPGE